jgi:putative Mn2+ efflux pump MntP
MPTILAILIIAFSLALDAFSVSIAGGLKAQRARSRDALQVAAVFGFFQAAMPLIGWLLGNAIRQLVAGMGGWIAFLLLVGIGAKMIWEARSGQPSDSDILDPKTLLFLGVATSLDALVAGINLSLIQLPLVASVAVIGVVTFILSYLGFMFGKQLGKILGDKAELIGGAALIIIGIKTLLWG